MRFPARDVAEFLGVVHFLQEGATSGSQNLRRRANA
jgi:hypothetical protein